MEWFLVLYLYSTTDVLIREFPSEKACKSYLASHKAKLKKDKDIKEMKCEEDTVVKPGTTKDIET